jgi:hypothetical protein
LFKKEIDLVASFAFGFLMVGFYDKEYYGSKFGVG